MCVCVIADASCMHIDYIDKYVVPVANADTRSRTLI